METWGELFWDAWIRLRLACRRLSRTYWPPRFKAWQVCTATGIVSIILTLVVLNLPSGKTDLQAKTDDQPAAGKAKKPVKAGTKASLAVATDDPFADADLKSFSDDRVQDDMAPPSQGETLESDVEPVARTKRRTEVALNENAVNHGADPALGDEVVDDAPQQTAPEELVETPAVEAAAEEAAPANTLDQPLTETEAAPAAAGTAFPAEAESPADTATAKPVPEPAAEGRDPVNYGRFGHHEDTEEDRHSVRKVRPVQAKDLPAPRQHSPFSTPLRPKGHYSSLGDHEDSEEGRHSVREIRPTRTDNVPTVSAKDIPLVREKGVAAPAQEEAITATTNETPTAAPTTALPPAPTESAEEAVPLQAEPASENVGTETELTPPVPVVDEVPAETPAEMPLETPVEAPAETPMETPVIETPVEEFGPTEAKPEAAPVEETAPVESESPPVLIMPEEAVPSEPVESAPAKATEYHGPVQSTGATDHEAHQEEDAFSRSVRRKSTKLDLPPARPLPPVKSTEPSDHEAHQHEDAFSRPVRKKVPMIESAPATPMSPVVEETPLETERQKPVESTEAPATPAETAPQVKSNEVVPRVIIEEEEQTLVTPAKENPHLDEDRVIPMGVTRKRGPEPRITVPERMPPVSSPEVVPSVAKTDSEFAPVVRLPAPRLMMEITGPRQVPVGTQVVLHFKLQNAGNAPATGIVVTDVLPPGLQHRLSADLEYTVARLMPGESRETNLTVQCVTRGTITNKAVLRADGDVSTEAEIQLEVTDSSASPSPPARAGQSPLTIKHHGPDRWLVDSTGQFLLTVTNTTNQPLKNVTITQCYPQGTNLVHATVGNKSDVKNRTVSWTINEFAPGVSYILETELHSLTSGPATSIARIKIGDAEVAEDRWTAVSLVTLAR